MFTLAVISTMAKNNMGRRGLVSSPSPQSTTGRGQGWNLEESTGAEAKNE